MIIHERAANNRHGFFLVFTLATMVALALLSTGCGSDNSETSAGESTKPITADQCGVMVDDTAWKVFADINARHQDNQEITRSDYQVFADLPIIAHWKESMDGNLPSVRIVNWLDQTFNPISGSDAKISSDRRQFSSSYAYSIKHQDEINRLIQKFQTDGHGCKLMENVDFWISKDVAPDTLILAFMPSKPEVRVFHEYLFVDTGVLCAGNMEQLKNQLTGILFRARMQLHGDPPTGPTGKPAVANSIRVMMNEGIIGFIEDQPATIFAPDHPKLGSINIVPENVFAHGAKAIELFNTHMPSMLADEKIMEKHATNLAKTFIASSSLNQGGFCMSTTIAANLGKEALRKTAGSPSAWLEAYQKAAKMNPVPVPQPYEAMDHLYLCMPPLDDLVYEGLQEILKETFPTH